MADISWEYLAGFWDGEGTFVIWKDLRPRPHKYSICYFARMAVVNTNFNVMLAVQLKLASSGIDSHLYKEDRTKVKHRTVYRIGLASKVDMLLLCRLLVPHLVAKREQAFTLIEFAEIEGKGIHERQERCELWHRMRALNRGKESTNNGKN